MTGNGAGPYQLFMLALCVYVLVVLGTQTVVPLDPETLTIFAAADLAICFVFFADFLWSLYRAPSRWGYFIRWGWIDLISSIPMVDSLRWGRAARVLRILRVLRGVRSTRILLAFIVERRAESAFLATALISLLLVVFSSIAILQLEGGHEANIQGAEDAIWWAFVTITTVGYGDRFPVTTEGRIIAAVLMAAGVGLFGTFTGFVAAWFLAPSDGSKPGDVDQLRAEVAEIKQLLLDLDPNAPKPPAE